MTDHTLDTRATWRDTALGTRQTVTLPQGALDVFHSGTGEPVVFLHGVLSNANLWRGVIPPLAREFHCMAIDLPLGSHTRPLPGADDLTPPGLARLVIGVLEALDLGPVTLVGNDSGGAISQLVLAARPDLIHRLVLTACDAYENFPPPAYSYLSLLPRLPGGMAMLGIGMRANLIRRLPNAYGWLSSKPIDPAASDSYTRPVDRSPAIRADLRRVLRGIDKTHTLAAAESFATFPRPVLLAWSADDRFFTRRWADRLAADFPDARLELIPDSRTYSPEDQPALLASTIATFLHDTATTGDGKAAPTGEFR
ncbi:alpha/beta fold hydrolase [Nocardia sp. NPDC020380]|uniref:alpha/beta fold hydrolase n=1 Tax=Nocardia sp. NPDC020380 TaxID=3364309 RepID=UPI0037AC59F3